MLALLLFTACGGSAVFTPTQEGCVDFDYNDPGASTVEFDIDEAGTGRVWRTNVLLENVDQLFEPEIVPDGDVIEVHEAWTGGAGEDPFCYQAVVEIEGLTSEIQVRWFLEGKDTPLDTVDIAP